MMNLGLVLFGVFLFGLITLDIMMIVSLIKPGDERKQMIVWKASTYTLFAMVGSMAIDIIISIIRVESMMINPFTRLGATALIYCIVLLYYKKKYGD